VLARANRVEEVFTVFCDLWFVKLAISKINVCLVGNIEYLQSEWRSTLQDEQIQELPDMKIGDVQEFFGENQQENSQLHNGITID
jgi:hypothetical protein